ncbi:MAG: helix-turn-helix domain-containing protein [Acidobacteriota bacterium]
MEATQSYPNLLSEKQAAAQLGVARITLLRAREAGRIKFFRIGTRVLYSEAQLIEFLNACERNGRASGALSPEPERDAARRKDNQVSSPRKQRVANSVTDEPSRKSAKADQVSLPF